MKKSVKILIVVAVIGITILIGYLGNSLISQRQQVDTRASQDQLQCPADGATCEWDPVTGTSPTPSFTPAPTSPFQPCVPDTTSGWPECRYGQSTYNLQACRTKTAQYKGVAGPTNGTDTDWFNWAQRPPNAVSCGTACGNAPSYCIVSSTPSPSITQPPTGTMTYRVEVTDLTTGQTILARNTTQTKVNFTPQVDHEYRCSVSVVLECGTGEPTSATNICRSEPQPSPTVTPTTEASPSATLAPSNTATPSPTATITPTPTNTSTPTPTVVTCLPPNTCMPQLDCNIGGGNVQNGTCPNGSNGGQQVCCSLPNNSPTPTATPTHTPVPTATFTPVPPTATPAPSSPPPVITQVIVNVTRVVVQNQVVQGNTQVVVITQPPGQPQQPAQPGQPQQPTQPPKQLPNAGGGAWMVILAPIALILAGLAL